VFRTLGALLRRNLATRLVILLMLALMLITGVNDYLRINRERERLLSQTHEDLRIFAETLAVAVRQNIRRGRTTDEVEELLDEILARPGLVAVAIFDPAGRVIAASTAPDVPQPEVDDLVRETLSSRSAASAIMEGATGPLLRYVEPFRWPGGRGAAIEVRQTLAHLEQELHRALRENVLSRLVVLAAFVLSIYTLTRWSISRPIRSLIGGARAIGHGDLTQRIDLSRRDEIGQLAEEFNRMAANLQEANAALRAQAEERLRLEQEVQQVQKMAAVGMLAAKVAHEIGTPLNVISGRAEVLSRVMPPEQPARRHLDVILSQTERIIRIIRTLLDYTRPKRPGLQATEILPVLGRVASLLLDRSHRRQVKLLLEIPPGLPAVEADPDQLQQIFLNLVQNALDASPPGSSVRLAEGGGPRLIPGGRASNRRGSVEGAHLALHVLDQGTGMTPEELDRIFEPFFSTKGGGTGTGLGLAVVEEIVRAHRGEIEVLSVPGQGSEAIVRLPLAAAPDAAPAPPAAEAAPHA
jgi:two-component system, NtrC family, sensor kinase